MPELPHETSNNNTFLVLNLRFGMTNPEGRLSEAAIAVTFAHWVLTTSNVLLPFCIIDLGWAAGYLRVISPHQRT